ncbi:MAG: DUF2911 domain-containing protein [Bacteroidota bacterium]
MRGKGVWFGIIVLVTIADSVAQINHPKASPLTILEQSVGLSTISVVYSRPAARGRHLFGPDEKGIQGLVPYGRIWRLGANASTKLTISNDMQVMGNVLRKGTYALYAFPNEKTWEIAFHTNLTHWGDGRKAYKPEEDAFRITVNPKYVSDFQENFLITFDVITHNSTVMKAIWGNLQISIPFEVDTKTLMLQEIDKQIEENPTAQTYYEAARYFQEEGKEPNKALKLLETAIALEGDTYYFHRVKSLVEAQLKQYENAIGSAKKSLELADALGKDEFVRLNQKNIALWEKELE